MIDGAAALVYGALYFALVTPVALWLRWRGRRPLALRPDAGAASYWIARPPAPPTGDALARRV